MEWDVDTRKFIKCHPDAPPRLPVKVTIADEYYKELGHEIDPVSSIEITAIADSGCQTSLAGTNILKQFEVNPKNVLFGTRHGILGITDTSLKLKGVVILDIEYNGEISRQLVYISDDTKGMFLSQKALKDLKIVDKNFPECKSNAFLTTIECSDEVCNCQKTVRASDSQTKSVKYALR